MIVTQSLRGVYAAKSTLKGIETLRAIKKGHFANNETGVLKEMELVKNLFDEAA